MNLKYIILSTGFMIHRRGSDLSKLYIGLIIFLVVGPILTMSVVLTKYCKKKPNNNLK